MNTAMDMTTATAWFIQCSKHAACPVNSSTRRRGNVTFQLFCEPGLMEGIISIASASGLMYNRNVLFFTIAS